MDTLISFLGFYITVCLFLVVIGGLGILLVFAFINRNRNRRDPQPPVYRHDGFRSWENGDD